MTKCRVAGCERAASSSGRSACRGIRIRGCWVTSLHGSALLVAALSCPALAIAHPAGRRQPEEISKARVSEIVTQLSDRLAEDAAEEGNRQTLDHSRSHPSPPPQTTDPTPIPIKVRYHPSG